MSGPQPSLKRGVSRAFTMRLEGISGEEGGDATLEESELVPSSLAPIVPILRAANEIEEENPRVAYLCRFTAFEKAHTMDPNSSGRGVRQFKTYLLHRLEKDEQETQRKLASTDAREIQKFYKNYCRENLEGGLKTRKPDEMARYYQIASVLYDVLKTVTPEQSHPEFDKYAEGVEKEKASYSQYNILPLNISGPTQPTQPVMEIPEIKAAVDLLRTIEHLPKPRPDPTSMSEEINGPLVRDLLDWLWQTFGFQKGNVENQKEHLILLLANIDMRKGGNAHQDERQHHVIQTTTVEYLMKKIFENYISWCKYLHLDSNIKIPNNASTQQPELLYIGLYLLIWGEASNPKLYVARGMYEDTCSLLKYTSFRPMHEITFATTDKPKLLSQLTCLLGELGLDIQEAHAFSTIDGYSLDAFVVTGWHLGGTEQLQEKLLEKFHSVEAQAWPESSSTSPSLEGLQGGESMPSASVEIPTDEADVWEIDLKLLKFGNKVVSGSNGDLFRGSYCSQDVAIKVVRPERISADMYRDFAQEVYIMRLACIHEMVVSPICCALFAMICKYNSKSKPNLSDMVPTSKLFA